LAEAGVRFIEITAPVGWDHHFLLKDELTKSCAATDQPIAALLTDLKQRGLLSDTLVIWAGEFGRTPYGQSDYGRDHNNQGYSIWMAGGGVKGGLAYGATDEYGYKAVEKPMHIHDWHATILHLLGLDHERLTFNYGGRDFRLTDVYGNVVKDILA
jgi:arylsulfatase A-like enzyme